MEIFSFRTKEEAKNAARNALIGIFQNTGGAILFLSAGGSALELVDGMEFEDRITVSVSDERYSTDPEVNNFMQLSSKIKAVHVIDTKVAEKEALEQCAQQFECSLREWKKKNAAGKVIITQGMGPDGHTLGITPYSENREFLLELFNSEERWVAGYDAHDKILHPLRITATLPFLRQVDYSVAYITGEKKKPALDRVLADSGNLADTPARIMKEMKNVKIFTDIV